MQVCTDVCKCVCTVNVYLCVCVYICMYVILLYVTRSELGDWWWGSTEGVFSIDEEEVDAGMYVCMYVCMYEQTSHRVYVCMYMCVCDVRVFDTM